MNTTELLGEITAGNITLKAALEAAFDEGIRSKKEYQPSKYKIIRSYSSGVFMGVVESRNGKEGIIRDARRLWYWDGAATLSQLAEKGTSKPAKCKFPCAVARLELTEIIEVIDITPEAKNSIDGVAIWEE
jgi:hypothetical protein